MTKLLASAFALTILAGLTLSISSAEARHRGINGRQYHQQMRIDRGIQSGELTGKETRRLEKKERKLQKQEQKFRASGGGLSNQERARLQQEENHLSKDIYRQKHDKQMR